MTDISLGGGGTERGLWGIAGSDLCREANLGQPWSFLVNLGHSWPTLVNLGQLWSTLVNYGHSWPTLVNHGHSWPTLVNLGQPKLVVYSSDVSIVASTFVVSVPKISSFAYL